MILSLCLHSQIRKKEAIKTSIEDLTPTFSLNSSVGNVDLTGFDVFYKKNILTSPKVRLHPKEPFQVIIFAKKKLSDAIKQSEKSFDKLKACLKHQRGGYFWCDNAKYLSDKQESDLIGEEWKIGGVYKIRLSFTVPLFALPGKYLLTLVDEKVDVPYMGTLGTIEKLKISIIVKPKKEKTRLEDYNLPLDQCLLNNAVMLHDSMIFPLTGDIDFFVNQDIKEYKKIVITAKGTPAFEIFPLLKVFIQQNEIGSVYISEDWKQYEFNLILNKESHVLKIRYSNDAKNLQENRNMYVKTVKLVR